MPSQHYVERACSALLRVQGTARCVSRSTTQCAIRALFYRSFTLYKSSASHQPSTHGKRTEGSNSSSPIASASGKKVSELLQQLNERRQLHHSHSQQRPFTAMDDLFKTREQNDTHASTSSSTPVSTFTASVPGAQQAQPTATQPPRRTLSLADMPALSLADCFDADEPEVTQKERKTKPLETDVDTMGLELPDTLYGMEEWSHVEDVMRSEENIEGMEGGQGMQEMNEYDMDESAATVDFTEDTHNNETDEKDESNVASSDAEDVTQEWPSTTTPPPLTTTDTSSLGSAIDDVEGESEDSVQAMELLEADDLDTIVPIDTTTTLNGNRESEQSIGEREEQAGDFDDRDIASAEMQSVGDSFVSAARKGKE